MQRRHSFGTTVLLWAIAINSPVADELTLQELHGRQIFRHGTSPSGEEITATLGLEGIEVSATAFPCVNCHGEDGHGQPEGGVSPSDIRWESLTKSYGVTHLDGRQHRPYTERSLKRAISTGIDPDGNRLHPVMPRYRLGLADAANLVAYVKRLGESTDPGLSDTAIDVAVTLPPPGPGRDMGRAVRAALTSFFKRINDTGGIYNRRIRLLFREAPANSAERADAVRAFLDNQPIFAMLSSYFAGAEGEIGALLNRREVPTVGTFPLHPHTGFAANRYAFYVYADLERQAQALVTFAARRSSEHDSAVAIICLDEPVWLDIATAIRRRVERYRWTSVTTMPISPDASELAATLRQVGDIETLFIVTPGPTTEAVFRGIHALTTVFNIFVPGSLSGGLLDTAPPGEQRVWLAFPTLPRDQNRQGIKEYESLIAEYGLPKRHRMMQYAALAAAKLLIEGLHRAGRALSRDKLVAALEELRDFETGFAPAVSFGPNRRLGSAGAYVISLTDLSAASFAGAEWIEVP